MDSSFRWNDEEGALAALGTVTGSISFGGTPRRDFRPRRAKYTVSEEDELLIL